MKCIILAAGYATRMYPLTKEFPKSLLKVNDKPILDYLIEDLEQSGFIDEYIVVSNHKFFDIFNSWSKKYESKLTVIDDGSTSNETRLGAVNDIKFALDKIGNSDNVLIMASDNLLDFSLSDFINYALKKKSSCVMKYIVDDLTSLRKTGVLELDQNDLILNMEEKPEKPKTKYACPPFYFYMQKDLKKIDEAIQNGCAVDAPGSLVKYMCKQTELYAFTMPGNRYDIGSIETYEQIKNNWRKKI